MKKLASLCWLGLTVLLGTASVPAEVHAVEVGGVALQRQTRSAGEFQAISVRGNFEVRVSQGTSTSVEVQTAVPLQALLETVVQGTGADARLLVRWKPGADVPKNSKALVRVVTPRLTAVSLEGAGDLNVEAFTTPALAVDLKGNGDVRVTGLSTETLAISLLGNGDVYAQGRATRVNVNLLGNGDIHLMPLRADTVAVGIQGNGSVEVNAERSLAVRIAGNGEVVYSGNAQLASSIAGRGSVRKK